MASDTQSPSTGSKNQPLLQDGSNQADDVTRALPHALGPEKSLLSSMLQEPQEWIDLHVHSADSFEPELELGLAPSAAYKARVMTKRQIEISCKATVVALVITFIWTCTRVLGMLGLL